MLNSFSGRLAISTSVSSFRVLLRSFLWNMFLYHLILPNLFLFLCIWKVGCNLGEVAFSRRCSVFPSSALSSGHQSHML